MLSSLIDAAVRVRLLLTRLLVRLGFREDAFFLLLAVFVGVAAAGAAVLFHELIVRLREVLYAHRGEAYLYGSGLYLLVLVPTVGGLVVGVLSKLVFRVKSIHGMVDVMESVIRSRGFLSPTVAVEKILTSGITIGTGGSVGAEAPIVQIGAAIASGFGKLFRLPRNAMPIVIGCGTAAGISSIFNSPIGGVLFTLEVILGDFSLRTFTPVVVASVIANVATQAIFQNVLGDHYSAIFALDSARIFQHDITWSAMPTFVVLGLFCGLIGAAFTVLLIRSEHWFARLRMPAFLKPGLGGLIIGILGIAYVLLFGRMLLGQVKPISFGTYPVPAFFSDGYGAMQPMLGPDFYTQWPTTIVITVLAGLLVLKLVAACITISSGGGGGIIGPALFIGAVLGGLAGTIFKLVGNSGVRPELYALVGMGAALAAVVHAPMASILILLELTNDYKLTLPAMLAVVTAVGVAKLLFTDSLYTSILRERGLHVGDSSHLRLLRRLTLEQVPLEPASVVRLDGDLPTLLGRMDLDVGMTDLVAVDKAGKYAGMLIVEDLLAATRIGDSAQLVIVADLIRANQPLHTGDDLAHALDRFASAGVERLAVVGENGKVVGIISRRNLIQKYWEAVRETS